MLEYARCNKMFGDAVIKPFDERKFIKLSSNDEKISEAIKPFRTGRDE